VAKTLQPRVEGASIIILKTKGCQILVLDYESELRPVALGLKWCRDKSHAQVFDLFCVHIDDGIRV